MVLVGVGVALLGVGVALVRSGCGTSEEWM